MKRIFFLLTGWLLLAHAAAGASELRAVMTRTDGRAWRVFLVGVDSDQLTIRLEKGTANTTAPLKDVAALNIEAPGLDLAQAQQLFDQAQYAQAVGLLEPVAAPAGPYMAVSNNLQQAFVLLAKAYAESGETAKAAAAAVQLTRSPDPELRFQGRVLAALCAVSAGNFDTAEALRGKTDSPAAAQYILAVMQRAKGDPKKAIQTAVGIIADNPNDMEWLPRTELLCARLYLDLGMPDSADSTARQVQVFYKGMNVAEEAAGLRKQIEKLKAEQNSEGSKE